MKKTIITLFMVTAFVMSLGIAALANDKTYELPVEGDSMQQGGAMPEFITNGTDNKTVELTWWILQASEGIVFEMEDDPVWWVGIIYGDWQSWDWGDGQRDDVVYTFDDGKMTILWEDNDWDFAGLNHNNSGVKMLFGQWGVDYSEHAVTAVYLIGVDDTQPEPELPAADDPVEDDPVVDEPAPTQPPTPAPTPELIIDEIEDELSTKFFGLDFWIWLVILGGAIIVVAILMATKKKN